MRLLDQVIGHQHTIEMLLQAYENGQKGQVHLFVGPSGVGKRQTAFGLSQALLCEKGNSACGRCASCLRVEQQHHEGLLQISPDGMQIKMEQAHEILHFLQLKSISKARVIIIDQAHRLNEHAANSLLKILEEPPAETYYFLIAPSSASVLPTIRSRSRIVSFKPLSIHEMKKRSAGPDWALRCSRGSFEKYQQLIDSEELENRQLAVQILQQMLEDRDLLVADQWRDHFRDRQFSQKIFSYWSMFLRDALLFKVEDHESILSIDQLKLLEKLSQFTTPRLLHLMQECVVMERSMANNLDAPLLVEKFFIEGFIPQWNG